MIVVDVAGFVLDVIGTIKQFVGAYVQFIVVDGLPPDINFMHGKKRLPITH